MSIVSLSSCLMCKDVSLGDIWCGGGRVSSAPLELRSHSAWWKQQNVAHYLGTNTSSCLELNPGTAMRAEECLTGGQGPSTDYLAGMHACMEHLLCANYRASGQPGRRASLPTSTSSALGFIHVKR